MAEFAGIIRPARERDLPRLTEIYNHYVIKTATTFDTDPFTVEQRREWFSHYGPTGRHRLLVAEEAGTVVGYTTTSRFHPRAAYDTTIEMTVLSAHDAIGRRIGQALYEAIFPALAAEDIHLAMALITMPNDASVALHRRFGFHTETVLHEVGRKFGRFHDVMWMSRRMDA